jgi:hypothetical protein
MLITWIGRDAGPSGKVITKEKGNLALNKRTATLGSQRAPESPCAELHAADGGCRVHCRNRRELGTNGGGSGITADHG